MKLLIVESPAKARKIKTFLGTEFSVEATMGHIREIPERELGVDIEHGFEPTFIVREDKQDVVNKLKHLAEQAEEVLIASDPDREGEAIASHVFDILPVHSQAKCKRVVYHEITKKAILAAIAKPREIDQNLVAAAKARQVLDRLIGYKVSPVLWGSVGKGTSAGRVQSVALKLVCERQREIDAFKPITFWYVDVLLKAKEGEFWARVVVAADKNNRFLDKKVATEAFAKLKEAKYLLSDVQKASRAVSPKPPFDTNSLQSAASGVMKWDISKTMKVAQSLYEAGKCFLPGTMIPCADGLVTEIENLCSTISLPSINRSNYAVELAACVPIMLQHDGEVHDLEADDGTSVSVTPEHIFPVFDSETGEVIDKHADEIVPERDFFLRPHILSKRPISRKANVLDALRGLDAQSKSRVRFWFSKKFVSGIPAVMNMLIDNGYAEPTRYKYLRNDTLPMLTLEKWLDSGIVTLEQVRQNYMGLSSTSKLVKVPFDLPPEIFYIAGLVASDGHLPYNSPKILLDALLDKNPRKKNIAEYVNVEEVVNKVMLALGVPPSRKLCFCCSVISKIIIGIGIPVGNKSKKIRFPDLALTDDDYSKAFLAGLWDGDGYFTEVRNKAGVVTAIQAGFTSSSFAIVRQVTIVLARFGIRSYLHRDGKTGVYTVKVSLHDVVSLRKLLGCYSTIKTAVHDDIIVYRKKPLGGRGPDNLPIAALLEDAVCRANTNKFMLQKRTGIDLWRYLGKVKTDHKRKPWIPRSVAERLAVVLDSDCIHRLLDFDFVKISSNKKRFYTGPVYCFQSSNGYFLAENGIWSHNCSYIRTDSFNISDEAMAEVRQHITADFGDQYLSKKPNAYAKKAASGSQEAHECIRPTHVADTGCDLSGDDARLYKLVRDRFIACQMAPMIVDTVKFVVDADCGEKLVASGQTIAFDGFAKAWNHRSAKDDEDDNEAVLPAAVKGEKLDYKDSKQTENKTKPPSRYTDASLAGKMEADGVGRPATRAPIIKSLEDKGYMTKDKSALVPTPMGFSIIDFLGPSFGESFMDIKFTAGMENEMAQIADGKTTFLGVVGTFWAALKKNVDKFDTGWKPYVKVGAKCSVCREGDVVERNGKFGKFLTCSSYPACKTIFAKDGDNYVPKQKKESVDSGVKCPKCGKEMLIRRSDYGSFLGCSGYPACREKQQIKDEKKA